MGEIRGDMLSLTDTIRNKVAAQKIMLCGFGPRASGPLMERALSGSIDNCNDIDVLLEKLETLLGSLRDVG